MSWSIEVTGTKAGASAAVSKQLDKTAAIYEGKQEAEDIRMVKARLLALIEAADLSESNGSNAVIVKANGSNSATDNGIAHASAQYSVSRTSLALGAA